ncbi:MAG: universal stress protein [Bacteroidota bacterium]
MKKILFLHKMGIDSRHPFSYAAKIARESLAELIILHTFTFDVDDDITEVQYKKKLKHRWIEVINDVMNLKSFYIQEREKKEDDLKLKFGYRITYGKLKSEILEILKEEAIDLIVYPLPNNNTTTELTDILLRSLFESTEVPVLVVPDHHSFLLVNKILYATDFQSTGKSRQLLDYTIKFAGIFNADIHFLHVSKNGDPVSISNKEEYQQIQDIIKADDKHKLDILHGNSVLREISQYVNDNDISLVIVVKHGRNFIESLFHQSFTNQITFRTREPILVLHETQ